MIFLFFVMNACVQLNSALQFLNAGNFWVKEQFLDDYYFNAKNK